MDRGKSDQLLRYLPAVDQEGHKSSTKPSICDLPKFYWIFKDIDFERWQSTNSNGMGVLWLSGPAECSISDASSRIVEIRKETHSGAHQVVLYFFCSTARGKTPITILFVSTIMLQLIHCLPQLKDKITARFLCALVDAILGEESTSDSAELFSNAGSSVEVVVEKLLEASSIDAYWGALRAVADIA